MTEYATGISSPWDALCPTRPSAVSGVLLRLDSSTVLSLQPTLALQCLLPAPAQGQSRESLTRLIRSGLITRLSHYAPPHSGSALGHLPRRNAPPHERLHTRVLSSHLRMMFTVRSSLNAA